MSNEKQTRDDIPTPGYRLVDLSTALQRYAMLDPDDPESNLEETPSLQFAWDWRMLEDNVFEVFLGGWVVGTPEEPQEVDVRVIGTFVVEGEIQALGLKHFVHTSAPAILMPYIREKVVRLTGDGPFGPYFMPIVNVQELMEGYAFEESTGAKQLEEATKGQEGLQDEAELG